MTAKTHVAMNMISAATLAEVGYFTVLSDSFHLSGLVREIQGFLTDNGKMPQVLFYALCIALYIFGAYLPDADCEYSVVGKIVHVPIEHRTWMHSIWFVLLFFIPGLWFRPLVYLAAGCFFHIFWDSFSKAGISWFYPKRNKHHIFRIYHTHNTSEYVFGMCVLILFAGCSVLMVLYSGII